MHRRIGHVSPAVVAAALLVLLAAVATGWAAGSAGGVAIHACAAKRGGALRLASRCRRTELPVRWNLAGPAGAPGRAGAAGAVGGTGPAGAVGPSDVYADGSAKTPLPEPSEATTVVASTNVPPGSYLLQGKATFVSNETKPVSSQVTCSLGPSPLSAIEWDIARGTVPLLNEATTVSLLAVQTFPAPQTVSLMCRLITGAGAIVDARVVAVHTQALHGETPTE